MSNNLGNWIWICFLWLPRTDVIYGNQEQSSCDEITTIMPGNNDIKSMLF